MPFARVARVARGGGAGSWHVVGSTVVRATISPTAALLLPLVASLLDVCLVLHCRAGMMVVLDKITMATACWSWGLGIWAS